MGLNCLEFMIYETQKAGEQQSHELCNQQNTKQGFSKTSMANFYDQYSCTYYS